MVTFTHHRNNKQTATTTIMFYKKACDIKLSTFLLIIGPFSSLYLNSLIKLSRSNPKLLYEISFAVFLEEKKDIRAFCWVNSWSINLLFLKKKLDKKQFNPSFCFAFWYVLTYIHSNLLILQSCLKRKKSEKSQPDFPHNVVHNICYWLLHRDFIKYLLLFSILKFWQKICSNRNHKTAQISSSFKNFCFLTL